VGFVKFPTSTADVPLRSICDRKELNEPELQRLISRNFNKVNENKGSFSEIILGKETEFKVQWFVNKMNICRFSYTNHPTPARLAP
jgi:hypothetical protein